jgi:transcription elongation GreA/GreB family factor
MNKHQLRQEMMDILNLELDNAINAARQAHDAATHEQSKAETQYDTLGLENAYLAHGLSKRIDELTHSISVLKNWAIKDFDKDEEIYLGALLTLVNPSEQQSIILLAPSGGGLTINHGTVKVITPQTPLGQALLGRGVEDKITLNSKIQFEILDLQ